MWKKNSFRNWHWGRGRQSLPPSRGLIFSYSSRMLRRGENIFHNFPSSLFSSMSRDFPSLNIPQTSLCQQIRLSLFISPRISGESFAISLECMKNIIKKQTRGTLRCVYHFFCWRRAVCDVTIAECRSLFFDITRKKRRNNENLFQRKRFRKQKNCRSYRDYQCESFDGWRKHASRRGEKEFALRYRKMVEFVECDRLLLNLIGAFLVLIGKLKAFFPIPGMSHRTDSPEEAR